MNSIFRNFISVVRRFKMAVILNILGLSIAFAAFMVIMIQLDYDFGFDKFHKDSDKIFRLEYTKNTSTEAVICRPFAERFFESSPHIETGALCNQLINQLIGELSFYVENGSVRNYFKEKTVPVTPEFADVFSFDFIEGSKEALKSPENLIIPLSLSYKLFGNESAIGRQFMLGEAYSLTVRAVYRDFPANTIVDNCIYGLSQKKRINKVGLIGAIVYIFVSMMRLMCLNYLKTLNGILMYRELGDSISTGKLSVYVLPHYRIFTI